MWNIIAPGGTVVAVGIGESGWSMIIGPWPGGARKGIWLTLQPPADSSIKVDIARPPVIIVDETEFDMAPILRAHLLKMSAGSADETFSASEDTAMFRICATAEHAQSTPLIKALLLAEEVDVIAYLTPREETRVRFSTENLSDALSVMLG